MTNTNEMTTTLIPTAEVLVNLNTTIATVNGEPEPLIEMPIEPVVEAVAVPVEPVAKKKKPTTKRRKTAKKPAPVVEAAPITFGGAYAVPEEETMGVIEQIRVAMKNPLAAFAGFILGGFVPVATFSVSHLDKTLNEYVLWTLVIGGLIYSALTVFGWAKLAFGNALKALGFVVLIEGVMTLSGLPMLSYAALALLVIINGIATGANLSIKGNAR